MQKKIFRSICYTVFASVLVFAIVAVSIVYNFYKTQAESQLRSVANVIIYNDLTVEEMVENLEKSLTYNVRITQTDFEGNVIFDSIKDASSLENHGERKEIKDALEYGIGSDTRDSKTTGSINYYYAVKDGESIYRFSRERSSFLSMFLGLVPVMLCVAGLVIAVATVVSMKLSENAIKPIQNIVANLDVLDTTQEFKPEYKELYPIVSAMKKMSQRLHKYINRLKEEKEKITLITDNMVEGMILLDEEGNILSVNKSAVETLNPSFEIEEETHILVLTRNAQLIEALESAEKNGSAMGSIPNRDKSLRFFINKASFRYGHGFIILLVDATEEIRAEEIRRDFSANVSHELKTPLTTIKGFGEMLENGIITNPDDIKKYGGTIFRESERLLSLINDIIRLSQIEEMSEEELASDVSLYKIALDVKDILKTKAEKQNVNVKITGKDFVISANPSYMSELLLNLTDNAIKYNNYGGDVLVKILKTDKNAVIIVKDTGIGISKSDQSRIFERFYRVDKSRSKQTGGTGLGLSIVKHIASYYKGNVEINSSEGKGTEIKVYIPLNNDLSL
ncbi:MAG: GHKL domain-containing protein [Clostridiales bacterium]|nr:GHKL domain-containing protein [Clostridiales bacterium]